MYVYVVTDWANEWTKSHPAKAGQNLQLSHNGYMDTWRRESEIERGMCCVGITWMTKKWNLKKLTHLPFADFREWLNLNIIPHCDRDNVWLQDKLGWGHTQ